MTVLKCKICGGSIQLTGQTHGVCEYCGNEVTLPKIDDDKRAAMYDRANYFRQKCRFDEAREAFMQILADDQQDAEAYWQILLCRYGIEYVKDPVTGEHKPTCHRVNYDPILEDPDYLNAIKHSDEYSKQLYRKEARAIAAIQEEYLAISSKVTPYDVFICFKQTDDLGRETQDCLDAGELYEELTQKGLKVFFSKWTLAEIPGVQYEPYIFSALNSAKVMLVVTSQLDSLNAPWVRNEWGRYLELRQKDKAKELIVAYRNISPYDFPLELQRQQGVDLSQITAKQNLVRGILRLLGKDKASTPQTVSVSATAQTLLTRARQSLEDGNFSEAKQFCNRILDADPENGWAYYYLLLADENATDASMLSDELHLTANKNFLRAHQYANEGLKSILNTLLEQGLKFQIYTRAHLYTKQKNYVDAIEDYKTIPSYRDSDVLLQRCQEILSQQEAHAAAVEEFKKETHCAGSYLFEQVKKESPDVFNTYRELQRNARMNITSLKHFGWFRTIITVIIAVCFFSLIRSQDADSSIIKFIIYSEALFLFTLPLGRIMGTMLMESDNAFLGMLFPLGLLVGSAYILYLFHKSFFNTPLMFWFLLIAGCVCMIIFFVQLFLGRKHAAYSSYLSKERSYITQFLLPAHTDIIHRLLNKYEHVLGRRDICNRIKPLVDSYPNFLDLYDFRKKHLIPKAYELLGFEIPKEKE